VNNGSPQKPAQNLTARQGTPHRKGVIPASIGGAILIAQFVLLFVIGRDYVPVLKYLGYALWIAGCVLAWLPIFFFRRKAGVEKGKSYVYTTRLVTTGIYSVVRHPQYLSFFVFTFALTLVGQHWIIIALSAAACAIFYFSLRGADQDNIEKFGDEYRRYKQQVPGYNILAGIIRRLGRQGTTKPDHF
jgi:protein-S-isoprenylcysteine O-methyltransferase Ste14